MLRLIAASALSLLPGLTAAQDLADVVSVDVLTGWQTETGRMAALRITLAPGWKTYWRAPGDAGIPPHFDWTGSRGVEAAGVHFPAPDIWVSNGMRSIGYSDQVVLPIELHGTPTHLSGTLDMGVCHDICVPVAVRFDAALPEGGRRDPAIVAALIDRPMSADAAGVSGVSCQFTVTGDAMRLTAEIDLAPLGAFEAAAIEPGAPGVWVSEPEVSRQGGTLIAEADFVPMPGEPLSISRDAVRITLFGGGRSVDIQGCASG